MTHLKRILRYIYSLYAFLVFFFFMFFLFPFVVIASFFGKTRGGNLVYRLCRFWSDAAMFLWGIRPVYIFESPHDASHPVIFVFNHISYLDIPVILSSFRGQPIRILGKAEMSKIPLFGFIYKTATVMVDRSDSANRSKSVNILKAVLRKNISVAIAPEGTFNMTGEPLKEFYDGAFRIAIETQTPVKPVLFLDTFTRLNYHSIFSLSPGICRTVFLEEVSVSGYKTEDTKKLKQQVFGLMEAALIKYNASWIKDHK